MSSGMDFYIEREIGCCDSINLLAPYAPWPIHRCKKDANFWKMNWISSCWLFLEIALSIGSVKFCMGLGMRTLSIDIKVGSESSMVLYYTDFKPSEFENTRFYSYGVNGRAGWECNIIFAILYSFILFESAWNYV